jgi:N-methylhydantoinase B
VARDVAWGKVSVAGARDDYGVVVGDEAASSGLRAEMRAARGTVPFFDRGPGYATLSGGRTCAEVDLR